MRTVVVVLVVVSLLAVVGSVLDDPGAVAATQGPCDTCSFVLPDISPSPPTSSSMATRSSGIDGVGGIYISSAIGFDRRHSIINLISSYHGIFPTIIKGALIKNISVMTNEGLILTNGDLRFKAPFKLTPAYLGTCCLFAHQCSLFDFDFVSVDALHRIISEPHSMS
jgi:hypothetical protein